MKKIELNVTHFLHPGNIFARQGRHLVSTILGSCVSVCFWDPLLRVGGLNHYLLPFWNGEGLPSPRFGNIAIEKLVEKLVQCGSHPGNLTAKLFGGAAVLETRSGILNVGTRNIDVASEMLYKLHIPVVASDVGGTEGRKVIFNAETGAVYVRKIIPHPRPSTYSSENILK